MASVDIEVITPETEGPRFDGYVALRRAEGAEVDPERDPISSATARATMRSNDNFTIRRLVAVDGDDVVGTSETIWWTVEGNTDKADVKLYVHPDHRRRGVASALLRAAVDHAESVGRSVVTGWGPLTDQTSGFWTAAGTIFGQEERLSRLWLEETDAEMMQRWVDQRFERAADYELVHYAGPTPPEHLEAMATFMTGMNDAPLDDLDYADDQWTADDIVAFEEFVALRDYDVRTSMVLAADGAPAGMTTIRVPRHHRRFGYQGDTVVLDAHRRRGIGRWVKADMWLRLRAEEPELAALDTENAESNDPMLGINVAMGFRPLHSQAGWQAPITTVRAALDAR